MVPIHTRIIIIIVTRMCELAHPYTTGSYTAHVITLSADLHVRVIYTTKLMDILQYYIHIVYSLHVVVVGLILITRSPPSSVLAKYPPPSEN